jgi:deoxyribose-phosphate aldolase
MRSIQSYLDSTYLQTNHQSGSEYITNFILESIENDFKLVMIRPEVVVFARQLVDANLASTLVGTVVDFPLGNSLLEDKILEAKKAIANGVDELDFVINYQAFKKGELNLVKKQVLSCTELCLSKNKTIKWIIESAALSDDEIIDICNLIKDIVQANFNKNFYEKVFIKSSTGFYLTENNLPNGATKHAIKLMIENGSPLLIKASGGIRSLEDANEMIRLGVSRIGTSSALAIINRNVNNLDY